MHAIFSGKSVDFPTKTQYYNKGKPFLAIGRASDCRSEGCWFKSGGRDYTMGRDMMIDKETTAIICITILGILGTYTGKYEITTACIGAIAGYITQTEKREGTE